MPLFWPHESQGLPLVISSGSRAGMRGSRGTLSPEIFCLHASCTMGERRFLRSASAEMTGGVLAATVISSGAACRYRRQMENAPTIL